MGRIAETLIDISNIEKYAENNTLIHSLDPRCKILTVLFFSFTVVSFNHYTTFALAPLFAFPLFIIIIADIPFIYLLKKVLFVSLFAFTVAIANPFLDHTAAIHIGDITISGGWLSFSSIMLRFFLTASAALLLLMTTGMYNISKGLEKLGVPHILTMQLFFLCRYIFSLTEEASRVDRVRAARSFGKKGMGIGVFNNIVSSLFIRSLDRAERVYTAMRCRGFDGSIKTLEKIEWKIRDTVFILTWTVFFIFCRLKSG
jgi:cobalt/nickel transport system permease protein